jgi:hypothetical protein
MKTLVAPSGISRHKAIVALAIVVFLSAFGLRCAYLMSRLPVTPISDELEYLAIANTLADSGVYGPTADKPTKQVEPFYAIFLSFFVAIDSAVPVLALFAQVLISSAACATAAILASRIAGFGAGVVTGCLATLYFHNIKLNERYLTDSLAASLLVFLLLAVDVWLTRANVRSGRLLATTVGILAAVGTLTRIISMPLICVACILRLFKNCTIAKRCTECAIAGSVFLLVFGAWPLRNYVVLGKLDALRGENKTSDFAFFWWQSEYLVRGMPYKVARERVFDDFYQARDSGMDFAIPEGHDTVTTRIRHAWHRLGIITGTHPALELPIPFAGNAVHWSPTVRRLSYLWCLLMWIGTLYAFVEAAAQRNARLAAVSFIPLALIGAYACVHVITRYQMVPYFALCAAAGIGWALLAERLIVARRELMSRKCDSVIASLPNL